MVMVRHSNGRVDHDGEYNPWDELDHDLAEKCRATGGFVFRTGVSIIGQSFPKFDGKNFVLTAAPVRHVGDGLQYVMFGSGE